MPIRLRKFIGAFLLLAIILLYAVLATTIATYRLADASPVVHLLYFFFTGLLWIIPAMFVIKWMAGPKKTPNS